MPAQLPRLHCRCRSARRCGGARIEDAKALSRMRGADFRATPVLRGKLPRSRAGTPTTPFPQAFTNGSARTFTAHQPERSAMRRFATPCSTSGPVPASAGTEGDPVRWPSSARRSLSTTRNPAVLDATIKGCSRIELAWLQRTSASICACRTAVSSRCWSWRRAEGGCLARSILRPRSIAAATARR